MGINHIPYIGEICSLLSAVAWAIAIILFKKSGERVHPIALNLFKNIFALILFLPAMIIYGQNPIMPAPLKNYLILFLSGIIGIGIADTLFFRSLNILGASLSAIMNCLYSPFVISLATIFLHEKFSILQIAGTIMIISAVLTATTDRTGKGLSPKDLIKGISFSILSMFGMAFGIVIAKPILNDSPILWANEIRLLGGAFTLIVILAFDTKRMDILRTLTATKSWGYTISGSFVGTFIALVLWLSGMKYAPASVASALNQTSQIFIFAFAAIFLRERIDAKKIIAIIMATIGVMIVIFNSQILLYIFGPAK